MFSSNNNIKFWFLALLTFGSVFQAIAQPVASFYATPLNGCNPLKVDFFNTSTGASTYLWKFGNGNESTITSPGAVYNNSGKFSVTLIAIASNGLRDTAVLKDYITVFKSPVANFNSTDNKVCRGDSILFNDLTTKGDGNIISWRWDFGDGGTSTQQNPRYLYTLAGKFDVTLAIKDTNGCEHSYKGTRFTTIDKPSTVNFVSNLNNKCKAPLDVTFTPTVVGVSPYTYKWSYGDGRTSTADTPIHTYLKQGNYTVSVAITDVNGCKDSVEINNLVNISPPIADFTTSSLVLCLGDKAIFSNLSKPIDGTGSFEWSFGNDSTSKKQNPEIVYNKPGLFDVRLTYHWDGCTSEIIKRNYIRVYGLPTGKISPRDTIVCRSTNDSLNFQFFGSNVGSVNWSVNNWYAGNLLQSQKFGWPKSSNGFYRLEGLPISPQGCKGKPDTVFVQVRGPIASFLVDSMAGCIPYPIKAEYNGSSLAPIVSYSWIGLGKTGNGTKMDFVKSTFGKSPIELIIVDSNGCEDKFSQTVDGGIHITPVFEVVNKICRNQPFYIYNKSATKSPDTVIFKYSWNAKDTINFLPVDSIRLKLQDTPDFVGYYGFISISRGCTTGHKGLPIKVMGPKLEASVKSLCDSDSFSGENSSTHYTSSYWKYTNQFALSITDFSKKLNRKISETQDLMLYAFNDTNRCSDSMPFSMKMDPVPASFTSTFNCSSGEFTTKNLYPGLRDSNFTWTITNTTNNKSYFVIGRHLKTYLLDAGTYQIKLVAVNPGFSCTQAGYGSQVVFARPKGKPSVSIDRNTCYPVTFTLTDPDYDKWLNAKWSLHNLTFKDSAKDIKVDFTGNTSVVWAFLVRTDSNNCTYKDTFRHDINGIKTDIAFTQVGEVCKTAVVTFRALLSNQGSGKIQYRWDFGYKSSTGSTDTIEVNGFRSIVAKLWVKNEAGCESVAEKLVEVNNGSPIAKFFVSDSTIACPPLNVNFFDQSIEGRNPIISRLWNFGDSSFSDKLNPGKLYIYPGKYSVTLTVINNLGCIDSFIIPELVVVKGPFGSYAFDKKSGCTPLDVALITNIKGQIKKLEFDMGDGAVLDAGSKYHKYQRPGLYIPRLIVIDSNGCKFSPQPTDTIVVHPNPIADFSNRPVCDNQEYDFTHNSTLDGDVFSDVMWKLNGDTVGFGDIVKINFYGLKQHNLFLKVTSSHNCSDSIEKQILVYGISPKLSVNKSEFCLGETAYIEHASIADTTIIRRSLWLDGKLTPDIDKVPVTTTTRGKIPATLIIEDIIGCKDTVTEPVLLKVGDTLPPPPLSIYRSSVVDNFSTETKFNASVEPDFKKYNLYVWLGNAWQLKASSEDVNDTNQLVSGLNTLASSYCHKITQVNYCGMETDSTVIVPHCTVEVKAEGDTNLARVWWTPYSGWNAVEKYRIYRKEKDAILYQLLDSVGGNTTQYVDTAVYCYVIYDYKIEAKERNGYLENSWSDTARAKPIHHVPVPAPEVWRTTVENNLFTRTEWIYPKYHKYALTKYTLWKNSGGLWEQLQDDISPANFDVNDYATQVQNQSYTYRLTATDVCDVTSPMSNVGKSIVLSVAPDGPDGDALVQWSPYIYWNEGVDEYIVERSIEGSPFTEVGRVDGDKYRMLDTEIPKYCVKDFIYRVTATRNQPQKWDSSFDVRSVSNYDAFTPEIRFFIPNAYTPNADNLNEGFRPDGVFFYRYEMMIYNRYGQKVYEGDTCLNAWNGMYNGEKAPDGVYAYHIKVWDLKNQLYRFNGTLHLLR